MKIPKWTIQRPSVFGQRHRTYCPKIRGFVDVASLLEFDRRQQLSYDATVLRYAAQEGEACAFVAGRWRHSIFDFKVMLVDGRIRYEEVKYSSELRDPHSRAHTQIAVQRTWCQQMGYEHAVVTDEEIWANPTLNNSLNRLMAEFTIEFPKLLAAAAPYRQYICDYVGEHPGASISTVLDARPTSAPVHLFRFAILEMVRRRELDADIERIALCMHSPLRLAQVTEVGRENW